MSEQKLDFSLPEREPSAGSGGGQSKGLLSAILALLIVNLAATLLKRGDAGGEGRAAAGAPGGGASLSAESLKELAMRTEKQGLAEVSAEAWREYLAKSGATDEEAAKIWYRVGKLRQDAGAHAEALNCYYRSESFAAIPEIQTEIARRTQECLEAMGKFAALKHDLAERVSLDKEAGRAGDDVVAEIGAQKITKADLDKRIESAIENQLAQFAAMLPEADRKRQKEQMLKRFSPASQRLQFLQQMIGEEVLYRRARETRLPESDEVRELLRDSERRLLAQQVIAREVTAGVELTGTDLVNHYKANLEHYKEPARAKVSHILLENEEAAKAVQKKLAEGGRFADLAKELSLDESTKATGGEIAGEVVAGAPVPGIGASEEFTGAVFATEAGKVAEAIVKTDKGAHLILVRERVPERTPQLDEIQSRVSQELRRIKEGELQEKLLKELKEDYNVVIHTKQFPVEEETSGKQRQRHP